MSNPAAPNPAAPDRAAPDIDPRIGLMFTISDHLVPLFTTGSVDANLARRMAVSAIEAYEPESRADYVNVARTIAFSISALALLGQAAAPDVTMAEKMRAYGRANALNRSADQSERTMMQRRRQTDLRAGEMDSTSEPPEADPDLDAAVEAAVAEAMDLCRAARNAARTDVAAATSERLSDAAEPAAALAAALAPAAGLVRTPTAEPSGTIRYGGLPPGAGQSPTTPYQERTLKGELLRHSAMPHRAAEQRTVSRPV
jgi:hypothetical protein